MTSNKSSGNGRDNASDLLRHPPVLLTSSLRQDDQDSNVKIKIIESGEQDLGAGEAMKKKPAVAASVLQRRIKPKVDTLFHSVRSSSEVGVLGQVAS